MLDSLSILFTLVGCYVWHWFTTTYLEEQAFWQNSSKWLRMVLHYYTIVFLLFAFLAVQNAMITFEAISSFGFADPDRFLTHAANLANHTGCPGHDDQPIAPLNWSADNLKEIRFDTIGVMRILVLGSCPAVVLTQIMGWWHIGKHMMRIKNSSTVKLKDNVKRDMAIQILLLPVIYSVIAYNNVIRLMNLVTGVTDLCKDEWVLDFEEKKAYTLTMYEANLSMADFYEAVALLRFTTLTVDHIRRTFKVVLTETDGVSQTQRQVSRVSQTQRQVSRDPAIRATDVMQSLVETVVCAFWFICFLQFARGVSLMILMAFTHKPVPADALGSLPAQLSGAGFIASSVAIANIFRVETKFHEELHNFKPRPKFLSIKVIVSIAFIQQKALNLLGTDSMMGVTIMGDAKLSEIQIDLLYCSLLCYEVLGVAVLHLIAWPSNVRITREESRVHSEEYWDHSAPSTEQGLDGPLLVDEEC
jgi:hypothetical protein